MSSSYHIWIITVILFQLVVKTHGGYWVCDWVNGRGWMYCSRGYCNTVGTKRSIPTNDQEKDFSQNMDGTFCLNKNRCYACKPINGNTCHLTLNRKLFIENKSKPNEKRGNQHSCL